MGASNRTEFLVSFAGGAVLIVLLKSLFASIWLAPLAACGLVGLYASRVWDSDAQRPRFDAAGDQVYYLGFLYTLASLAASLVQVGRSLGNDPDVIRGVLTGFGVAISSTILGMALRVWLGGGEESDPEAAGASARADLADAGRRLRAELDYTVAEFEEFRTRVREQLGGLAQEAAASIVATQEHAGSAEQSLRAFENAIAGVSTRLSGRAEELSRSATSLADLEAAAVRLTGGVDSAAQAARRGGEEIIAGASEVGNALVVQANRIEGVDFRRAFEEQVVAPAAKKLRAAVATLETNIQRLDLGWEKRSEVVERAGRSADRLAESLGRVAAESQNLSVAVAGMTDAAAKLRTLDEHVSRLGEELRDERREAVAGFAAFRDGVLRSAKTIASVNEHLVTAQSELAAVLREKEARRRWWRPFSS